MRVGIAYPEEKYNKVKTLRLLRKNNVDMDKITALIDIPDNLVDMLEGLGNKILPIEEEGISDNYMKGFEILNRVFLKAIEEENKAVMEFLRKNMTEEEIKLLGRYQNNVLGWFIKRSEKRR